MTWKAADLCCGLGGWTEGLLAEGYEVRGYDVERHSYDGEEYPADLILRDILTMHGSELADVDLIVASPPCQRYSYMAMPWKRGKAQAAEIRAVTIAVRKRFIGDSLKKLRRCRRPTEIRTSESVCAALDQSQIIFQTVLVQRGYKKIQPSTDGGRLVVVASLSSFALRWWPG